MTRIPRQLSLLALVVSLAGPARLVRGESPAATRPSAGVATYTNPVLSNLPDPFIIRHDGVYYAYGTNAPGDGYRVFSSPDLVHWADRGYAFHKTPTSWGRDHFWAPCVVEHNGAFYLIYSCIGPVAPDKMSHRICIAKSASPTGPFVDIKAPLLDIGTATIDAHVMIDDGKAYLYYVRDCSECPTSDIYVVRLNDDLTQVVGEPAFCTKPDAAWEGDKWNEGPFVFKWRDKYIMMYSARGFFDPNYALGLATADNPMGPFKKSPDNPILHKTDKTSGPGHNSVIASPDGKELFCAYHIHRKLEGGHERDLAIDRMTITKDAAGEVHVKVNGPSRDPQPMPSGAAERAARSE